MCHDVGHEEGDEEPAGHIAEELACGPQVGHVGLFDDGVVGVEDEEDEEEVYDVAYGAPHGVGDEEALGLVEDEVMAIARDSLVEVACLEEEEGHEEVCPRHDGCPPAFVAEAAGVGDVEHDHADDADAAEEVEGVVALFHGEGGTMGKKEGVEGRVY